MTVLFAVDFALYVLCPRVSAEMAMPLALRLANAKPGDLTREQLEMLHDVQVAAQAVHDVQSERERSPEQILALRLAFQNDWSALYEALGAASRSRNAARRKRATEIVASLFPNGVAFLKLETAAAWSEGQRRLERIESEGLRADIGELSDAEYVNAVKRGTRELGDAIGVGDSALPDSLPSTGLQEVLARFSRAVGRYLRSLVGQVDEDDEASVERFRRAVAPIDEQRAGRSNSRDTAPSEPVEPPATTPSEPEGTPPVANS